MLGSLEGGTCQSSHSYASRWMFYTTSLLSALETAACLPAHLLAGSKVPLWLALKRGEEEGQRVESVCGREERKKKNRHHIKIYIFLSFNYGILPFPWAWLLGISNATLALESLFPEVQDFYIVKKS